MLGGRDLTRLQIYSEVPTVLHNPKRHLSVSESHLANFTFEEFKLDALGTRHTNRLSQTHTGKDANFQQIIGYLRLIFVAPERVRTLKSDFFKIQNKP